MSRSIFASLLGLAAVGAAMAAVAPASADTPEPRRGSCAFVSQINNFKEIDDHTAIIETSPSRRYKVTFVNSCREMKWAHFARVSSYGRCLRMGDKIIVGRHGFADHCIVRTVEPLPPKHDRTASNAR